MKKSLRKQCEEIYEAKGVSAVFDLVNNLSKEKLAELKVVYENCTGCESESPAQNSCCLVCGQATTKISGIKKVSHNMSIMSIPENALLHGVVTLMKGHEAFKDATDINERIYQGDIFEELGGLLAEIKLKNPESKLLPSQKVFDQLDELAVLVDTDYLMITQS